MTEQFNQEGIIPESYAGHRVDQALASLFPEHSRSRMQSWISNGQVTIDNKIARNKDRLFGGEAFCIHATIETQTDNQPEDIALNVVYEDEDLLIIDKPIGLIVHPGAGNPQHTLLNALLHHHPALKILPRAGIVHRLDKNTSGLMVVAKTLAAHTYLVRELQARRVHREYETIVDGTFISGGTVNAPMGRHPKKRTLMAVIDQGKEAITHYKIQTRFTHHTHLRITLETGRTHQIRVHLSHIGHPIVGDPVYGWRLHVYRHFSDELIDLLRHYPHQALHAYKLGFTHPKTGQWCEWISPLPEKMSQLLTLLRQEDS